MEADLPYEMGRGPTRGRRPQAFGRVWHFFRKCNILLLCDPAAPPGVYQREMDADICPDAGTGRFVAAVFQYCNCANLEMTESRLRSVTGSCGTSVPWSAAQHQGQGLWTELWTQCQDHGGRGDGKPGALSCGVLEQAKHAWDRDGQANITPGRGPTARPGLSFLGWC